MLLVIIAPTTFNLQHEIWLNLFLSNIVICSIYLLKVEKKILAIGIVLGAIALVFIWLGGTIFGHYRDLFVVGFYIAFLFYIVFFLLRFLIRCQHVDSNTIYAAMCLYIFIANIWMFIYTIIFMFDSQAFSFSIEPGFIHSNNFLEMISHFSYFSFVTLTTLGYGDILPATPIARAWVSIETIVGQFYLAIILARLVSISLNKK